MRRVVLVLVILLLSGCAGTQETQDASNGPGGGPAAPPEDHGKDPEPDADGGQTPPGHPSSVPVEGLLEVRRTENSAQAWTHLEETGMLRLDMVLEAQRTCDLHFKALRRGDYDPPTHPWLGFFEGEVMWAWQGSARAPPFDGPRVQVESVDTRPPWDGAVGALSGGSGEVFPWSMTVYNERFGQGPVSLFAYVPAGLVDSTEGSMQVALRCDGPLPDVEAGLDREGLMFQVYRKENEVYAGTGVFTEVAVGSLEHEAAGDALTVGAHCVGQSGQIDIRGAVERSIRLDAQDAVPFYGSRWETVSGPAGPFTIEWQVLSAYGGCNLWSWSPDLSVLAVSTDDGQS